MLICLVCCFFYTAVSGSLLKLNADEITEEVGNMWKIVYKLTKSFPDVAGPRRLAENMKYKLDKFKQHLPVLSIACNRGMKERHWKQVL